MPSSYIVQRVGSVLILTHLSTDYEFRIDDSYGNNATVGIKDQTQNFEDLPKVATNNFPVEIVGDTASTYDNYHVTFKVNDAESGQGIWKETHKEGLTVSFEASTMPHKLEKLSNGTFIFGEIEWDDRTVGDYDTSPFPSFTGRTINNIGLFKDRLVFLSDENIICSRQGSYMSFFPKTVQTLTDKAPIDIGGTTNKASILRAMVSSSKSLNIFSDLSQFTLEGDGILSPKTAALKPTTNYEVNLDATPVDSASSIFAIFRRGQYTGVREFRTNPDQGIEDTAEEVSSHVPEYIQKSVFKIAASANEKMLLLLNETKRNQVHVYQYYDEGNKRLISSWHEWLFDEDATILNVDFIDSDAYLVIQRPDGVYLEVMEVQHREQEDDLHFLIHLDRKTKVIGVFDSGNNKTVWTLPYTLSSEKLNVIRDGAWVTNEGLPLSVVKTSDTAFETSGDYSANPCYVGIDYTSRYRFSKFTVRQETGDGKVTVQVGRLQITKIGITFANSGYFRTEVTPLERDTRIKEMTGRVIGSGNNKIGVAAIESGTHSSLVSANNKEVIIDVVNDKYLPMSLNQAEWTGTFNIGSRRI